MNGPSTDLAGLAGYDLGAHVATFDDRDAILYALAVGAGTADLDMVFERNLRVLPTYGCALGLRGALIAISVLVVITLATGGLVAGTRAGLVFNTFPLMGGSLVPPGYLAMEPVSINFFENVATIQFNHRLLAIATLVVVLFTAFFGIREARAVRLRQGLWLLLGIVSIQVAVGITVLLFYVPVSLAVVHQGLALLVFTVALYLTHRLSHP